MSRPTASADIFVAIADPTRRSLLDSLRTGEQPVKQLADHLRRVYQRYLSTYRFCVKPA